MKFFLMILVAANSSLSPVYAQDAIRGAELYKQCISCHGVKGDGNQALKAPRISGLAEWYTLKQLQDIKAGSVRKNQVMLPFLTKLSEQDMKDLAAYISKL